MEIYIKETRTGPQMFATFNFSVLEEVMPFERQKSDKPKSTSKTIPSKKQFSKKHPREESSEEEEDDEDDDDDECRRSPTPEASYLGRTKQPSATHREWNYRYQGRETGEYEVQLGEDENVYQITFIGTKGRTLEGNIGSTFFEECEFIGVKIRPGGTIHRDITNNWAENNEAA